MAKFDQHGCRIPQTLFEAAAWHFCIVATCRRCGTSSVFESAGLWWHFECKSWETNFASVATRLKCKICSGRPFVSAARIPPTIELPLPSERDWKRAVSRFRS